MNFRVDLASYRGPLDLLLYLVRKHEVDVTDIPIAEVADQFAQHLDVLQELDIDGVGEFLEMASTLMEIKSRLVLPRVEEDEETLDDPREELVHRLLEYKKYRDAASLLEDQGRQWQLQFGRLSDDLPPRKIDPADQPIQELELWDLVSAFSRIIRDSRASQPSSIVYDETPIQSHMARIRHDLQEAERLAFSRLLESGQHKSAVIGMFLVILELVRHHRVQAVQDDEHGEIWICRGQQYAEGGDWSELESDFERAAEAPDEPGDATAAD